MGGRAIEPHTSKPTLRLVRHGYPRGRCWGDRRRPQKGENAKVISDHIEWTATSIVMHGTAAVNTAGPCASSALLARNPNNVLDCGIETHSVP